MKPKGNSIKLSEILKYGLTEVKNDIITPNGEVPYQLLSRSCFYCLNLIIATPQDKEIYQVIMS